METSIGQKRARDDVLDEGASISNKKLCEGEGASGLLEPASGEINFSPAAGADGPCLSSTTEIDDPQALIDEAFSGSETERRDGDAEADADALSETMKSLEEELGQSDDSTDYTSSVVEDFSSPALANWSSDIWNVQDFEAEDSDVLVTGNVNYSGESSPAVSESPSSRNSSGVEEDSPEKISAPVSVTGLAGGVDIGFLCEASDDELGIPPSPFSEREQSGEQEQSSDQKGLGDNSVTSLQEAVSWALQESDDVGEYSGIDEWMTGSLDFMMENPSDNFGGSSLLESGSML